jgi:hypothetical protein
MTIRDRAWRRAQRRKAVAHALPIVSRYLGHPDVAKAVRWADNLRKCSCPACSSGSPHDSRQFRRADAALRDQWLEVCDMMSQT